VGGAELRPEFVCPQAVKCNADKFYVLRGDMIDYIEAFRLSAEGEEKIVV